MGKYADKYVSLPKFEGDAKPGDIVSLIASADAEIARLQREKAELEAENSRLTKSLLDLGNHNIFNREIENKYNALVERVKAHNAEMLAMCENNPKCVKKKGYRNIRCLDCPKENLIDLDTVVGVNSAHLAEI